MTTRSSDASARNWYKSVLAAIDALNNKNIGILSAGIAYYGVLAFFPFIAVLVAVAGLTIHPQNLIDASHSLQGVIPADIYSLITTQLTHASGKPVGNIIAVILGLMVSVFAVSGATGNMMTALNAMYDVKEKRSFVKQRITSITLTIGLIMLTAIVVPLLFAGGDVLRWLGIPEVITAIFNVIRWFLLAGIMMVALAILYHFGPSRIPDLRWQWLSWGAIIATFIWVAGSALFFLYLQYFANFNNSYSLFAGLIALMVWMYLSSFIVLLGAEINYNLERRSKR